MTFINLDSGGKVTAEWGVGKRKQGKQQKTHNSPLLKPVAVTDHFTTHLLACSPPTGLGTHLPITDPQSPNMDSKSSPQRQLQTSCPHQTLHLFISLLQFCLNDMPSSSPRRWIMGPIPVCNSRPWCVCSGLSPEVSDPREVTLSRWEGGMGIRASI